MWEVPPAPFGCRWWRRLRLGRHPRRRCGGQHLLPRWVRQRCDGYGHRPRGGPGATSCNNGGSWRRGRTGWRRSGLGKRLRRVSHRRSWRLRRDLADPGPRWRRGVGWRIVGVGQGGEGGGAGSSYGGQGDPSEISVTENWPRSGTSLMVRSISPRSPSPGPRSHPRSCLSP